MKAHPIIPVPDRQITDPISFIEALGIAESFPLDDEWIAFLEATGRDAAKKFLQSCLIYGSIDAYVYDYSSTHWARVPAFYHTRIGNISEAYTFSDLWGDLGPGGLFSKLTPNYSRYLDSPLMVLRPALIELGASLVGDVTEEIDGAASSDQQVDNVVLFNTGIGGRPNARHIYMAELQRRIISGDVCSQIIDEAQYLCDWTKKNHPLAPVPGPRAMENAIRDRFNRHRAAARQSIDP